MSSASTFVLRLLAAFQSPRSQTRLIPPGIPPDSAPPTSLTTTRHSDPVCVDVRHGSDTGDHQQCPQEVVKREERIRDEGRRDLPIGSLKMRRTHGLITRAYLAGLHQNAFPAPHALVQRVECRAV